MKALTVKKFSIKCDEPDCDWIKKTTLQDAITYHNVPCPKCNKNVIINNDEIQILNLMAVAEQIEVANSSKVVSMQLDTLDLRNDN